MKNSPILLFVYNRPDHTLKTLEALSQNTLAKESHLFIFADGPKQNSSVELLSNINETRKIIKKKKWCKEVTIYESPINKGLATSIIDGVTEIINEFESVIVLEDDIVTGKYFLEFMNEALKKYKNHDKVWHITGWRSPVGESKCNYAYFYPTMNCWSWATWKDRWKNFKKDPQYYKSIFSKKMIYKFNVFGSEPGMWQQIEDNINHKINTWAIFWYATIFINNGLCLAPSKSLCKNIGLDNSGVHCGICESEIIKDGIDWKITIFPNEIKISKKDLRKNITFLKSKNNIKALNKIKYIISKNIPANLKNKLKKILK